MKQMAPEVRRESKREGTRQLSEHARRIRLLKRTGLFTDDTKGARIRRATSVPQMEQAYRLVHDAFVERDYINPHPSGIRLRPYEADPATGTFIALQDDRVVGVQSVVIDSPDLYLPSDQSFQDCIDQLRIKYRRICEATNEAVAPEYRRSGVPTDLMRCMFAHAYRKGCDAMITTVSPGHQKFYEFLGFEAVSDIRDYSSQKEDPVVVMCWDLRGIVQRWQEAHAQNPETSESFLYEFAWRDNHYRAQLETWEQESIDAYSDARQLAGLFAKVPELFAVRSEEASRALRSRLGDVAFALCHARVGRISQSA